MAKWFVVVCATHCRVWDGARSLYMASRHAADFFPATSLLWLDVPVTVLPKEGYATQSRTATFVMCQANEPKR